MGTYQLDRADGAPLLTAAYDVDTSTLVLCGELDIGSAPLLEAALATHGPATIDMAAVSFVDSSGLRVLVAAQQGRTANGSPRLLVRDPSPVVQRVLALSGLTQHFAVVPAG
jgi:anti-anti-sigma factor